MNASPPSVSIWRQAAAFVCVSVCGSLLAAVLSMAVGIARGRSLMDEGGDVFALIENFFGVAIIAWLFVFPGGLIVGVPALLLGRHFGMAESRGRFLLFGGAMGLLGSAAATAVWFTAGEMFLGLLPLWLLFGGLIGVLAALLWWFLVERLRREAP